MHIPIEGDITEHTTAAVLDALAASGDAPVVVRINSQGGVVQAGVTIYEALKAHRAGVTVEIVGWALSVASLIAMAGKTIRMAGTSLIMVHAPWVKTSGNASQLRQTAETLEAVGRSMRAAYARTGQTPKAIERWLSGEHWFTAEEAIAAGLADEILHDAHAEPVNAMACAFAIPSHIQEHIMSTKTQNPTPTTIDPQAAARFAELERREAIRENFKPFARHEGAASFLDTLLADNTVTAENVGPRILTWMARDATSVAGRGIHPHALSYDLSEQSRLDFVAAATDAILMRAGQRIENPHPAARDLRGKTIAALAENLLSMDGVSTSGMSGPQVIQAAMGRDDLPLLLQSVTARSLREAYETAPSSHSIWTAEREVADFRPQTLVQMSEAPDLEKVGEHGEYTSGYFAEAAETFAVETFGRIISVTRQALVNDDLGGFTRVPAAFGAAARRLEADHVYAKLTGNPVMADGKELFHADHGNLAATPSALGVESLAEARAAMRGQRTLNGLGFLDMAPRYLIVPTVLETEAESLLASLARPDGAHSGVANPGWIRNLELVSDPRLDDNSETAWYLAASPSQIETILRAYLAGTQRPDLIESEEFIRDVFSWKSRLDFGTGVIDYRGLYKNAGA